MLIKKYTSLTLLSFHALTSAGCLTNPSFMLSREDFVSIAQEATKAGAQDMMATFEDSATSRSLDTVKKAIISVEEQARARDTWVDRAEAWMTGNTRGVADNKKDLGQVKVELSAMATNQENMGGQLESLIGKLDYALMGIAGSLLLFIINMALEKGAGGRDPPAE